MKTTVVLHADTRQIEDILRAVTPDVALGIDPYAARHMDLGFLPGDALVVEMPLTPDGLLTAVHRVLRDATAGEDT